MKAYVKHYWPLLLAALVILIGTHFGFMPVESAAALPMLGMVGNISFNTIPANVRVPLFYAEMDNSAASYFSQSVRTLIIGQKLAAGVAPADVPILVSRTDAALTQFGIGSMLARMHEIYRANDSFGEVWCLPLDDNGAGTAATGTLVITGPAGASGVLNLYIGAQRVQVAIVAADTADTIAAAIAAAINADTTLPVTAAVVTNTVTLTARHKGTLGNGIKLQLNYRGLAGGETTPTGVAVAITAMSGGAGDPSLTAALAALGDEPFDFIIMPYSDSTSLDALKTLMNDTTGRWAYNRQIYGHVYTAKADAFANLVTLGAARNDQHATIAGYETGVPNTAWDYAAAYGARNAVFIAADPARPTQTGELIGILPAPAGSRFIMTERQTLLNNGIATSYFGGGAVRIERAITTYQKNSFSIADPSYLDSETLHTLAYIIRRLRSVVTSKYARHKLANDGTRFGAGQAIVTPSVVRGELLSLYADMEEAGIVENAKAFAENLIVERNADDPNRLDVLLPLDLVNQLRIFAVLAQFRLNY